MKGGSEAIQLQGISSLPSSFWVGPSHTLVHPDPRDTVPACAVELAPLQGDLDHVLPQAHEQDALAVQDLQASDGLPPPLREELNLFQQTAA